jgi:predicted ATPase
MILSASFRNFKSLRHVDVEFERLTVFVGPNASGKTSILEGLHYLAQLDSAPPKKLFSGRRAPTLLYSRGVINGAMQLECCTEDAGIRVQAIPPPHFLASQSEPGNHATLQGTEWKFRAEGRLLSEAGDKWHDLTETSYDGWVAARIQIIASKFQSTAPLWLDAKHLAEPSYTDRPKPRLEYEGTGLASVLALLALNQPDRFNRLQEHLRSVIPSVTRIRFNRVPVTRTETEVVAIDSDRLTRRVNREYMGDELLLDFQGTSDIPAHLASEGTILVLGILAGVLGPFRPRLILLDDLEHGLHPKVQRQIVPILRKILEEDQELQIIATTHSPYIVDEFDPKEVRITWAGEDGVTRCGRLDSHPEFERWKEELWPGEFWSLVGEQWVANGQGRESR